MGDGLREPLIAVVPLEIDFQETNICWGENN